MILLKGLKQRILRGDCYWYLCTEHHVYHNACQVGRRCIGLQYIYRLPGYIKRSLVMQRPVESKNSLNAAPAVDGKFSKMYPMLWEYITTERWEDGEAREPSSLSIFCEGGILKGSLADRDQKRSVYVSAGSVEGVIHALEKALASGAVDWRAWGSKTKKLK